MGLGLSRVPELSNAIKNRDCCAVEEILNSGLSVNSMLKNEDMSGSVLVSPLYSSITHGSNDILRLLVSRGADVSLGVIINNMYSRVDGESPLHCACRLGNIEMVEYLLNHGCDVNSVDQKTRTPLCVAIDNRNVALVAYLLSRPEVKVNMVCKQLESKERPLHRACSTGISDMVELLLCHGSDVNVVDDCNITPLFLACQYGYTDVVNVLLKAGADVNICRNSIGWKHKNYSPLHVSIKGGHCDIVGALVTAGVDLETQEATGRSGLFLACEEGYVDIVKMMLDNGADPNTKTYQLGQTPLFCALHSGLHEIHKRMKKLTRVSSARVSKYDSHSFVVETLELLLQHRARHDVLDSSGYTACDYSIMLGQVDTTCILLRHGATISKDSYSFNTSRWEDWIICKILLLHSRDFVPLIKRNLHRMSCTVKTQISEEMSWPPSLLRQSRYRIRNLIRAKTSLFPYIDMLPVPDVLKTFLKLDDAYDAIFTQ